MKKNTLCDSIAQQRDVGSALYWQNKASNKIATARNIGKEEGLEKGEHKKSNRNYPENVSRCVIYEYGC